jgi:hypothetical protein
MNNAGIEELRDWGIEDWGIEDWGIGGLENEEVFFLDVSSCNLDSQKF